LNAETGIGELTNFLFPAPSQDQYMLQVLEHEHAMRRAWALFAMVLVTVVAAMIAAS